MYLPRYFHSTHPHESFAGQTRRSQVDRRRRVCVYVVRVCWFNPCGAGLPWRSQRRRVVHTLGDLGRVFPLVEDYWVSQELIPQGACCVVWCGLGSAACSPLKAQSHPVSSLPLFLSHDAVVKFATFILMLSHIAYDCREFTVVMGCFISMFSHMFFLRSVEQSSTIWRV